MRASHWCLGPPHLTDASSASHEMPATGAGKSEITSEVILAYTAADERQQTVSFVPLIRLLRPSYRPVLQWKE